MWSRSIWFFIISTFFYSTTIFSQELNSNKQVIPQLEFNSYELTSIEKDLFILTDNKGSGNAAISVNGTNISLEINNGISALELNLNTQGSLFFIKQVNNKLKNQKLYHISKQNNGIPRIKEIPLWYSILPPLIAILCALFFKEVIVSLFFGIWTGAFIIGGLKLHSFSYWFNSLFQVVEKYVIKALNNSGHLSVIVFSLLIGGMVSIISKNGGMAGVVKSLSKYAKSPRSTQFITWLLGVAIFFDDYANTLIVGKTMKSVTDKFRVSREKLAYIVDSTAAPVAAIAFVTTWIGAELGYIQDGLQQLDIGGGITAYGVFLASLKFSFYPILTLIFILLLIYLQKDFGPMLKAERRARSTGHVSSISAKNPDEPDMEDLSPVSDAPLKWYNAVIPIACVIICTLIGLISTGMDSIYSELSEMNNTLTNRWGIIWSNMYLILEDGQQSWIHKLGKLVGSSDSYIALLWASVSGLIVAILLTISQKIMSLFDTMHWLTIGLKTMLPAIIILTLAWSLAITTEELHTADFISSSLEGNLNPLFIPSIVFILAAVIAFSTGSSWSTMAILYPIAIPATYAVCMSNGMPIEIIMPLLYNVIATVLAASVLGDHCSPISDTTILSSLASDCNHLDHVKTQLPYALLVGMVSLLCVTVSAFMNGGVLLSLVLIIISVLFFYFVISKYGKECTI